MSSNSPSFKKVTPNGTFGVLSKAIGHYAEFDGDAAGSTYAVAHLDAGACFTELVAHYEAMGAGTGLTFGIEFYSTEDGTDDPDYFGTVADSSTAGKFTWAGVPETFKVPLKITATVTGAAGTGRIDVVPEYVFTGAYS